MTEKEADSPSAKPGDIITIGDGFEWLTPLTPLEVGRLEKALGKKLDDKAQRWLLDAMRMLIVGTAKRPAVASLKDYKEHLQRISDASEQLLCALTDKSLKTTPDLRFEFQSALGGPTELQSFLANIDRVHDRAKRAVEWLQPRASRPGGTARFIDKEFLRTIVSIAQSVGADISLPSHRNSDDDERPVVAFAQHALWLAVERARAMAALPPGVIDSLEKLHDRSNRALIEALERAVK